MWLSGLKKKKKNSPAVQELQETRVPSLGPEDPLEEEVATYPSILPWRIPLDGGVWWATVHRLRKSWTWLKWLSVHTHTHTHGLNVSPSNFTCESSNPQYLKMWPYLETGSLQMQLVKMRSCPWPCSLGHRGHAFHSLLLWVLCWPGYRMPWGQRGPLGDGKRNEHTSLSFPVEVPWPTQLCQEAL